MNSSCMKTPHGSVAAYRDSIARSQLSARLSNIAYFDCKDTITRELKPMKAHLIAKYDNTIVAGSGRTLMVGCRGTNKASDIVDAADIRTQKIKFRSGATATVHRGFYDQYCMVERSLRKDVKEALESGAYDDIVFTGHSMGAGVAVLAALDCAVSKPKDVTLRCHTFGAPHFADRVLINELMAAIDEQIDYQLTGDVVTQMRLHPKFKYMPFTVRLDAMGRASCLIYDGEHRSPGIICTLMQHSLSELVSLHTIASYMTALDQIDFAADTESM